MKGSSLNFIKKPMLNGIAVFTTTAMLCLGIAYQSYIINKNQKQTETLKEINTVKYNLKSALSNGLSASKTLAFIINKYETPKDFDSIAEHILESNKYIDALELTQKGIITNVYPLKGNEGVIGYDVLADSLTSREAYKAVKLNALFFAGPLNLKQGGVGVVGRLPFFKDNRFEGFCVVIIKLSTLLKAAGLSLQNKQFIYQLSKVNPITLQENFFLPSHVLFDKSKSISVTIPEGEWKLYVMQKETNIPFEVIAFSLLGFVFSIIAGLFTWFVTGQPARLNSLVDKKTAELMSIQKNIKYNEARLAEAQKVAKIGSWETDLVTLNVIWSKETFRIFEVDEEKFPVSHPYFLKFVHPDDKDKVDNAFRNSFQNSTLNIIEHRIITPDGKIKHIQERWQVFHNEEGKPIRAIGTCHDISERITIQAALKESEKKYKYLFENNPIPMFLWDFETLKIIDCNQEALIKYGYSRDEFLNLTIKDIRPIEDIPLIEATVKSEETYGAIHNKVWRHKKKNGELMFLNINAHLIDYNGKRVSLTMLDDVTEKLKVEKEIADSYNQLQELTTHLQVIREEERTRIAREIHDELGQQLTALKMDASWISKKLIQSDKSITEKLSNMIALINDTIKTVRRISSDLRPGILDDLGLIAALEWQGEEYEKRTGIKWKFSSNINDITLDKTISTNMFRIFQEALTNIIKHSIATQIEASVEKIDGHLVLIIKDNGQGFNLSNLKKKDSWGIVGMKERANLLKGELLIESEKLKGTTITLKVPLN
ncbi:MAG: PAS domain S-box protein [Bacteroidota bacterium]|nr:PAS domain S-box protein [Bacteroidota bacterium]